MRAFLLLLFMGLSIAAQTYKCAPSDINMDDVASASRVLSNSSSGQINKVTIGQTLKNMKARCSGRRLVDRAGREIRFYRRTGCWGNPPENYVEILQRQREELERLKKKFTVVEITCNPSGYNIPSRPNR